jgi:hypothetical protein
MVSIKVYELLTVTCIREGSGLGRSVADIKKLCPQSTILDGLAIWGRNVKNAKRDVAKWLNGIGMIKNKVEM